MNEAILNQLADAAGLEPRYWDIQGQLHERSPETARQLLCALGIPANTEADIAASLAMLAEEPWLAVLPPVIVGTDECEIEVPVRLPMNAATQWVRWSIELEGGGQANGEQRLDSIRVEDSRDLGGSVIALRLLRLPPQALGYHRLRVEAAAHAVSSLIVAPAQCYLPPEFSNRKYWGITAQLYAIKSRSNWGIGDFGDLRAVVDWLAASGADAIGLNPLHALFLDEPRDASPYSPNSRLFLNPLYLDITAIPDFSESPKAHALLDRSGMSDALRAARTGNLVDYQVVAATKLTVLNELYQQFGTKHSGQTDRRRLEFKKYIAGAGDELRRFTTFQMLSEHFGTHEWTRWPIEFQDPASDDVTQLLRSGEHRVSFFQYLQWQCQSQLSAVADRTRESGMSLGLYSDLAVSVASASADHWANQEIFVRDARVGAPPDPFNESGQEWGVVPLNPRHLRAAGYAHFSSLLRANMQCAGALRIDHVMGWQRLFIIPAGASAVDGAYVRFPLDDLLSIAALESRRNKCLLVGEDLGTVPAGFRKRMADANVLSCRILYFEQEHGSFHRPDELPELACVSAATHDLATLRGYWMGDDISAKSRIGIFKSSEEKQRALVERARDKALLLQALRKEGLLPDALGAQNAERIEWTSEISIAIHAFLARSRSRLFIAQMDDLGNERHQANLPGSTVEYPNWRRRLDRMLEELTADPEIERIFGLIVHERQSAVVHR
jgi:4-alpha-glucanotransferase